MPARRRVPAYKLHKPSGQARVILDGRHVYLGPHGCAESREKYARLIAEQFRPGGGDEAVSSTAIAGRNYPDLSINEMLLRYTDFAERYYVKDGKPTHEVDNLKYAMGSPLRWATSYDALPGPRTCHHLGALRVRSCRRSHRSHLS